jgi:hypothetical protein
VSASSIAATAVNVAQTVVAEIEGEKITSEQVEKSIAAELTNLQEPIYNLKRQRLDAMINERLVFRKPSFLSAGASDVCGVGSALR